MCFFILRKAACGSHWGISRRAPSNPACWYFSRRISASPDKLSTHVISSPAFSPGSCLFATNTIWPICNTMCVSVAVSILPPRKFPQLAVCQELISFYSELCHNLGEGLNCLHFHRLKQEELCILLRGYHSPEELYTLLKSVIGNSDNFKDFVLQNYLHVNDVGGFASLANMSIRNFQRKFKAEFKRPVREWLNERRAERILRDIRNTDKSIAEIAASYGFATSSYFTIFCKQYFGMTPSELRRGSKPTSTKGNRAVSSEFSWGGEIRLFSSEAKAASG